MARNRVNSQPPTTNLLGLQPVGPARFTVERFLGNCSESSKQFLLENWAEGNILGIDEIPVDALPCVVIMACYARQYGVDIVDNYTELLDKYWWELPDCFHADKFFASCICILDERGEAPSDESFESINIPNLYEEFFP